MSKALQKIDKRTKYCVYGWVRELIMNLIIPSIIKDYCTVYVNKIDKYDDLNANQFNQLPSSSPTKKIRLSSSTSAPICYIIHWLYPQLIGIVASFLEFSDYFLFKIINKSIHKSLVKYESLNSLDLIHKIPRDKDGNNITKSFILHKIGKFSQLQHLSVWASDLKEIQFCKANTNLKKLTIMGDGLDNDETVCSSDLNKCNINYIILSWFGSRDGDDEFSFSNFSNSLFKNIEYLFMYCCVFKYIDLRNIVQLFEAGLKGWGYYDAAGQLSSHASFTNFVIKRFSSNLEALHVQGHTDIDIPNNIKFNKLKEFCMVSWKYNNNDMNITNDVLSKVDTIQRFAIEILSASSSGKKKSNLENTIQALFMTQQKLQEITLFDHYIYKECVYNALEYGLYFSSSFEINKIIIVTIKFDNMFTTKITYEALKICVDAYRLINCLLGCYLPNNWRLNMEFRGSGLKLYKQFKILDEKNNLKKLRNDNKHQIDMTYWKEKGTISTFRLEIYSKKCIIHKPNRWIFSSPHHW